MSGNQEFLEVIHALTSSSALCQETIDKMLELDPLTTFTVQEVSEFLAKVKTVLTLQSKALTGVVETNFMVEDHLDRLLAKVENK